MVTGPRVLIVVNKSEENVDTVILSLCKQEKAQPPILELNASTLSLKNSETNFIVGNYFRGISLKTRAKLRINISVYGL